MLGDIPRTYATAYLVPWRLCKMGGLFHPVMGGKPNALSGTQNALLLSTTLASIWNEWALSVVPGIPKDATAEWRRAWAELEHRLYNSRVWDSENAHLKAFKGGDDGRWGSELDNQSVQFLEDVPVRPITSFLLQSLLCRHESPLLSLP